MLKVFIHFIAEITYIYIYHIGISFKIYFPYIDGNINPMAISNSLGPILTHYPQKNCKMSAFGTSKITWIADKENNNSKRVRYLVDNLDFKIDKVIKGHKIMLQWMVIWNGLIEHKIVWHGVVHNGAQIWMKPNWKKRNKKRTDHQRRIGWNVWAYKVLWSIIQQKSSFV